MRTNEEQESMQITVPGTPTPIRAVVVIAAVCRRWRWIAKMTILGLLVTVSIAFLIPNKYESTAQLMPSDPQSLRTTSTLSALSGSGLSLSGSEGGLFSQVQPGQTVIGVLTSTTCLDDIINRFDLRRVYRHKLYFDTRKELTERSIISEQRQSGIITITVTDRDPYRAKNIASAYIEELNKLLSAVNSSEAHRERLFLEARLDSLKKEVDATSARLSQFSSRNATLNPESEGTALVDAASRLQAESIAADSELQVLKEEYTGDSAILQSAQTRVDELHRQLRKLWGGSGASSPSPTLGSDQLYPSIRELPILGVTYSDLRRQLTMQETVYALLTRQYELAKIQEAKEIPLVKVLDQPSLAEKKSFPHRLLMICFGGAVSILLAVVWVVLCTLWQTADSDDRGKVFAVELMKSIRDNAGNRHTHLN